MKLLYLLVIYLKSASWLWGATDNVSRFFVCENFVSNEWNTWNGNPDLKLIFHSFISVVVEFGGHLLKQVLVEGFWEAINYVWRFFGGRKFRRRRVKYMEWRSGSGVDFLLWQKLLAAIFLPNKSVMQFLIANISMRISIVKTVFEFFLPWQENRQWGH